MLGAKFHQQYQAVQEFYHQELRNWWYGTGYLVGSIEEVSTWKCCIIARRPALLGPSTTGNSQSNGQQEVVIFDQVNSSVPASTHMLTNLTSLRTLMTSSQVNFTCASTPENSDISNQIILAALLNPDFLDNFKAMDSSVSSIFPMAGKDEA